MAFEVLSKTIHPKGWPEKVVVREVLSGDIFGMGAKPDREKIRQNLVHASVHTEGGDKLFPTPSDVDKVPLRMMPGLQEIITAVMELNQVPEIVQAGENETPT